MQLQLPTSGSPVGDVPVPGPALEPQRCLCAGHCPLHTCAATGKQLLGPGPFLSAAPGWHHPLSKSTGTPKALPIHFFLSINEGTLWHFQGQPRLWTQEAQARLEHPFPPCPLARTAVAMPPPRAGMPYPDLIGPMPACHPAPSLAVPLQPLSPSCCHPRASDSPVPRGCSQTGSPSLFPFPGKGEGASLISSPCPADEPGDCDELWVHRASTGFLASAGQLGAIACLLPAQPRSRPAVPRAAALQRAPCSDAGTAIQTPTLPCPPRRWTPGWPGHRERGDRTGQWHCWGPRGGHRAEGCHAARHGRCWQNALASSSVSGTAMPGRGPRSWQCPSPGDASGQPCRHKPGYSLLPSASSCQEPGPRQAKPLCPTALPGRAVTLHETCAKAG